MMHLQDKVIIIPFQIEASYKSWLHFLSGKGHKFKTLSVELTDLKLYQKEVEQAELHRVSHYKDLTH